MRPRRFPWLVRLARRPLKLTEQSEGGFQPLLQRPRSEGKAQERAHTADPREPGVTLDDLHRPARGNDATGDRLTQFDGLRRLPAQPFQCRTCGRSSRAQG